MSVIEHDERPIDRQFSGFLGRLARDGADSLARLLFSMASRAAGKGDVCLDLSALSGAIVRSGEQEWRLPTLEALTLALRRTGVVGEPGANTPLVLDAAGRLYLHRYREQEASLARTLLEKAARELAVADPQLLEASLDRLFPPQPGEGEDFQRSAARRALHGGFTVISGGPGTGKTSTVVKILALLREQPGGMGLRIAMAAPTGKAAARLQGSVSALKGGLDCSDALRSSIPESVTTLHRLLGVIPGSTRFRHHETNPLPCDVAIVDEASMVALPLMHAFVTALPPHCRLILLGDRDQLASVEPGAVLGDLCRAAERQPDGPMGRSMVVLRKNWRFADGSAIGDLAAAVNAGKGSDARSLMERGAGTVFGTLPEGEVFTGELADKVLEAYGAVATAAEPSVALEAFSRFRILAALREGAGLSGVRALNAAVERVLRKAGLIDLGTPWYEGRPVLVTANDYALKLYNGDTGIVKQGALHFPMPDGTIRRIPPERLPAHETAWAMTIHKSQGSEFDCVLMILPHIDSDLLTRELLYTAITRARSHVTILGDETVFMKAIKRRTKRSSGLRDMLM